MMLTPRQAQVAELIYAGRSQAEIASSLNISISTVKVYAHQVRVLFGMPRYQPLSEACRHVFREWIDAHRIAGANST